MRDDARITVKCDVCYKEFDVYLVGDYIPGTYHDINVDDVLKKSGWLYDINERDDYCSQACADVRQERIAKRKTRVANDDS